MSLCDQCTKPGNCCKELVLTSNNFNGNVWAENWKQQAIDAVSQHIENSPFVPIRLRLAEGESRDPAAKAPYGTVLWSCTRLTPEGRCGDYENRPQLCREYEAGSDRLCAMHVPFVAEAA